MSICCDVCGGFATGGALHLVDADDELVVVCRACELAKEALDERNHKAE